MQAKDRDNANDAIIDFASDHMDIIFDRFNPALPPCFKEVKNKAETRKDPENENEHEKGNKSKKREKDQDAKQQRKQRGQPSDSG